jgi:hypothetical protein
MVNAEETQPESAAPRGHIKISYLGPLAPHWNITSQFGEKDFIEDFKSRIVARLMYLPPHDPQFKRNRERIIRDAEREGILLEWELGNQELGEE